MHALFVHGMGRSPLSGARLLWSLRRQGISISVFSYVVTFQAFDAIVQRLARQILRLAKQGDYVLIGHSLGGVLIRSAITRLPEGTRLPKRVFLLGSPVSPSRIATFLRKNWLYWLLTQDCGQLLASAERMEQIPACEVPTTSIVGTKGFHGRFSPFGNEPNDGAVTESELFATWIDEEIRLPVTHTFMSSTCSVTEAILHRLFPQPDSP